MAKHVAAGVGDYPRHTADSPAPAPRIVRRSLHDEVVEHLRDMIVTGQLAEGGRLREKELCDQLGVSRTPLREAFKVLAVEGLVEILPNRGARILRLTLDELEQMFEIIGALEGLSGELACKRITADEIAEIKALNDRMVACFQRNDLIRLFKIDQEIHRRIVNASRNKVLRDVYTSLNLRMRRARYIGARKDARQRQLVDDHIEMIKALTARDAGRIGRVMRQHIRNKWTVVREARLSELGSASRAAE